MILKQECSIGDEVLITVRGHVKQFGSEWDDDQSIVLTFVEDDCVFYEDEIDDITIVTPNDEISNAPIGQVFNLDASGYYAVKVATNKWHIETTHPTRPDWSDRPRDDNYVRNCITF